MIRKSNFELLRIISMLMIIGLHYFGNCNANELLGRDSNNYYVYYIIQSLFICSVNVFVLITGYFSVNEVFIKMRKIVVLLIDVIFWGAIGYFVLISLGLDVFNFKEFIKNCIPFIVGRLWFLKVYIILVLLIPFINILIKNISKSNFKALIIICTILFSVWPSFFPHPPVTDSGFGIIQFIYLYLIAAYIRIHLTNYPKPIICLLGYLISAYIIYFIMVNEIGYSWSYNYLFVIIESIFLFLLFAQFTFKSKIINNFASSSFVVYLIHSCESFMVIIYDWIFDSKNAIFTNSFVFLLNFILCLFIFYLFGYVLDNIKQFLFKKFVNNLIDKLKLSSIEITIN